MSKSTKQKSVVFRRFFERKATDFCFVLDARFQRLLDKGERPFYHPDNKMVSARAIC